DGLQLHGTDISQIALDMARQRGIDATFYRQPDLPSIMCNTIVMSQVLEHLDDDEIFVQQAKERLVSDGLLIVSVPRNGSLPSPDHKRDYTEDSLRELLSNVGKPVLHSWPGEEHRILMTVRNE
ncbi:MAG: class I SAM-dependent methyltransferase, partial [Deltaproteobacteria bacterium]|nr:class I SAM-dependent methyltransferase [Deltaproteobacteria bacterium]